MKITGRIKTFLSKTRRIRHQSDTLVAMISLYYFINLITLFGGKLLKLNSEISEILADFATLAVLSIIYIGAFKYDLNPYVYLESSTDNRAWRKRRMTFKLFVFFFILTTAKGVISILTMDLIYALKGLPTPTLPGTVRDLGTAPSMLIRAIVIGPITEELLFREAGMNLFRRRDNKLEAIILTGVVFGLMHGNLAQAINATIGGFIYGYIAVEFGVLYSILFHMINNGMVYLEYFLNLENVMYYLGIAILLVLIFTRTKRFIQWIKWYSRRNRRYSFKRQLVYFMNPTLIVFMTLWITLIILSV